MYVYDIFFLLELSLYTAVYYVYGYLSPGHNECWYALNVHIISYM